VMNTRRSRLTKRAVLSAASRLMLAGSPAVGLACGVSTQSAAPGAATKPPVRLLTWYAFADTAINSLAVKVALDDFQAKNPGRVTVEIGEGSGAVALAKIKAAVAANTPPNLWNPRNPAAADLYVLGAVVDLNAALKGHKDWSKLKADVIPTVLEGVTWKGKVTMTPLTVASQQLAINKRRLAQAGVSLPATGFTWNDFVEMGRRTAQPPERVLFDFRYQQTYIMWWMYSNGQRLLSADRTKLQYDAPITFQTLEWLHDHVVRTQLARNGPTNFNDGQSVTETLNAGTVVEPRFPNIDPGDGSGIYGTHYPYGPSNGKKEQITYGSTYGLSVFKVKDEEQVTAAAEIAAWALRTEVQAKIAETVVQPPATLTAGKDENLPKRMRENPILKTINGLAKNLYPAPNMPSFDAQTTIVNDTLARLARGELRPIDTLAEIQRLTQGLLDEDLRRG
jgi:ABC-type glycerol-3-phosphate transport system substrate-binding protein